jgi:hypothetical protein
MGIIRKAAKNLFSEAFKTEIKKGLMGYQEATSSYRILPDWLVIGAQKCGTSSLYYYLQQHPDVITPPNIVKEPQYFNRNYSKGVNWYKSHFPTKLAARLHNSFLKRQCLAGEATPEYIYHPHAARRISEDLPNAKFIVLLRDPIERAHSHWRMQTRRNIETENFEQALELEEERINTGKFRMDQDENIWSDEWHDYSYKDRGIYVEQLEKWFNFFERKQFLIITSESLFENPRAAYSRVTEFLNLPSYDVDFTPIGPGVNKTRIRVETREMLKEFYMPFNERLGNLLELNLSW